MHLPPRFSTYERTVLVNDVRKNGMRSPVTSILVLHGGQRYRDYQRIFTSFSVSLKLPGVPSFVWRVRPEDHETH